MTKRIENILNFGDALLVTPTVQRPVRLRSSYEKKLLLKLSKTSGLDLSYMPDFNVGFRFVNYFS